MLYWLRQFLERDVLTCGFYACLLFVCIAFLYHLSIYLSFKIRISAECWFCMKKTRVCLANRNSWTCSHCLQYNGFSESGCYNKVIDEQYGLNEERYCQPSSLRGNYEQHRLCNECNKNQEMKIKLLADFVPLDETNFDKEATEFRKHLESVYKLCSLCELLVEKVLEKPSDFSYRRSPQKPPTLNSTADYSSTDNQKPLYKRRLFTSSIWPIITYVAIAAIVIYLFGLSNSSFIEPYRNSSKYNYFKNSFSFEHAKLYERHCLVAVLAALSLYALLIYSCKTLNLFLDSLTIAVFSLLASSSSKYRLLNLVHDSLIELHQMLFAFIFIVVQINGWSFLYLTFCRQIKQRKSSVASSKINDTCDNETFGKSFNFTKCEDKTTNIRQQIKELCLTDLDSSTSDDDFGNLLSTSSSISPTNKEVVNPFSTYTTAAFCLTPNRAPSPFSDDLFSKSSQSFSYFQCAYSKPDSLYSNGFSAKSAFGSNEHCNSKGPFITLTSGATSYLYNEHLPTFLSKSQPQYSPGSPRILNYYVNYGQQLTTENSTPLKPIEHEAASSTNISIWISNMLHTFELILLLVIIGLIIILLSMPITLSYSSEFNNFSLNIVVNPSA